MSGDLPAPAPPVNPETERFWDATADGTLLLERCEACGTTFHYPRARCPECGAPDTQWFEASGRGTVYSYTVTRQTGGDYADATPFVLAYVELEEGPRMMTNLVDCDHDDLAVGRSVSVVFHDTGEGNALPRFSPD
jgi:hypothetical protein